MTQKLSVAEQLDAAIRTAAQGAELGVSSREAAESFYDSEPELMGHFARDWIVEKVAALVRRYRARERPPEDVQMVLGFTMPARVVLKSGEKVSYASATLTNLRQYRARVYKEKPSVVRRLDAAIAWMMPYQRKQRGITFGEALALAAKKRGSK